MAAATLSIAADTLALAGVLDFESVPALDAQGREWLAGAAPAQCSVDLSGIGYSSSVGIALLLGWLRFASAQHKRLSIRGVPDDLRALARVGGLEDLLGGA